MADIRFAITTDQKPSLTALIKALPGILSGRLPDVEGIAYGFRSTIGHAVLSLVEPNFNALGRGETGVDGTKWPPLSPAYLAYRRRFKEGEREALINASGSHTDKKQLTKEQKAHWDKTYKESLARHILREPESVAKDRAKGIAWLSVHNKTQLKVFGDRTVQILVDTGYLRGSITPGELVENGVSAEYNPPSGKGASDQEFDISSPYQVVVGTNVEYAKYHHFGKGNRHRPLWPESFPQDWWNQILGACIMGLQRINELYRNEQGV